MLSLSLFLKFTKHTNTKKYINQLKNWHKNHNKHTYIKIKNTKSNYPHEIKEVVCSLINNAFFLPFHLANSICLFVRFIFSFLVSLNATKLFRFNIYVFKFFFYSFYVEFFLKISLIFVEKEPKKNSICEFFLFHENCIKKIFVWKPFSIWSIVFYRFEFYFQCGKKKEQQQTMLL